jgi:hypothetical protein
VGGPSITSWGTTTRPHGDIDVSTLRPALPALLDTISAPLRPFAAMNGSLVPLADHLDDPDLHNIWVRDDDRDRFILQINLEDGAESGWRYRREPRITLPWDRAVVLVRSVPTGTPATQLLGKSKGEAGPIAAQPSRPSAPAVAVAPRSAA